MAQMNLKELRELIDLISEKGFAEFEVERQGFRLRIVRFSQPPPPVVSLATAPVVTPLPVTSGENATPIRGTAQAEPPVAAVQPESRPEPAQPEPALHTIKSPIVGTFYRAASPNAEPFVTIGAHVEPDSVVCIIEAMKLMNEIQAEVSGEIVKVYAENGQPVEYGQPLFGVKS